MKILILLFTLFTFNIYASVPACGSGQQDSPQLDWSKALDIKVDMTLMGVDAILCLGNMPGDLFNIEKVIYRDSTGMQKIFLYEELEKGTQVLLSSDDIDFAVLKNGPIMTLQLKKQILDEGVKYNTSLRFLRNLAKIPFDSKDFRELKVAIDQDRIGDYYPKYKNIDFDEIKVKISAPSLVIKEIDLIANGNTESTVKTKQLKKVSEL
jgi:hypothetical protein